MPSFTSATQFAAFISWTISGRRTRSFFLISAAVILMGGASTVRGQSALDGFDPNANSDISSIAVQADGKILAGGSFTNIGGQARNKDRAD